MATYIGYTTIDRIKNVTITDFELIKRDLLNAFNIRQGEVPGRPNVGTALWNYIFESQSPEIANDVYNEVQRVVGSDPRIFVSDVQVYVQDNGILIQLEVDTIGANNATQLSLLFDETSQRASYV